MRQFGRPAGMTLLSDGPPLLILQNWASGPGLSGSPNECGLGPFLDQFDTVIVGAGSAGCVLANRLSADPNTKVCSVEAGGSDNDIWIHFPVGYFYTFDNPCTDWRFRTEPDAGLNGRSIKYPRGRVMGGTSSINGMVYIRGQSRDDDGWRQQGCVGWTWDDVLSYSKKSEDHARGADEYEGFDDSSVVRSMTSAVQQAMQGARPVARTRLGASAEAR